MKISVSILLSSIFLLSIAVADDLPDDAVNLLEKLDEFAQSEHLKAERAIAEKRKAVAVILKQFMERETKAGNLEAALAVKGAITELSSVQSSSETSPPEPNEDFPSKWTASHPARKGLVTIELSGQNKAKFTHDNYEAEWECEITGGEIFVWGSTVNKETGWKILKDTKGGNWIVVELSSGKQSNATPE